MSGRKGKGMRFGTLEENGSDQRRRKGEAPKKEKKSRSGTGE
jgi:hypothetical protein